MKIIRDKYKDIIPEDQLGVLTDFSSKYTFMLEKLTEELGELKDSLFKDPAEFADVIEVLFAIAKLNGVSQEVIEDTRLGKLASKGGFDTGLILIDS